MRVLVSGSHGLIGSAIVAALLEERHTVLRVVRGVPSDGNALLDRQYSRLDCTAMGNDGLDGIDVVINLSGEQIRPMRWSSSARRRIRTSRVATTRVLAEAIAGVDDPPSVFVSASATGYYGNRGEEELDESSSRGHGFLADLCRDWEAATSVAADRGVRVVNIRSGVVIARGNSLIDLQLLVARLGLGARIGNGTQWVSWISLADEVQGILHALRTPSLIGPCNLVAPTPVRNSDFVDAFAAAVGRRARLAVPRFVVEAAIGRGTAEETVLTSQRVIPRKLLDSGFAFAAPNIDAALATALGRAASRADRGSS